MVEELENNQHFYSSVIEEQLCRQPLGSVSNIIGEKKRRQDLRGGGGGGGEGARNDQPLTSKYLIELSSAL